MGEAANFHSDNRIRTVLVYAAVVVVTGSIAWAFAYVGTPQSVRLRKFDQERISDLKSIRYAVEDFYDKYSRLPDSLSDLRLTSSEKTDPKTQQPYGYSVANPGCYKLSADFALPNRSENDQLDQDWEHDAGANEFTFDLLGEDQSK